MAANRYNGNAHYSATGAVHNVSRFIQMSGDISFIVFRQYRYSDAERLGFVRAGGPSKVKCDETVAIVSQPLQEAVNGLSQCFSFGEACEDDLDGEPFDETKYTMEIT